MQIIQVPFTSKIADSQRWVGSPAVAISGTGMDGRRELVVTNNAGTTLYLGSTGVIMPSGTPLGVGRQVSFPIAGSIVLYGVGSGAGSADVRMLEFG